MDYKKIHEHILQEHDLFLFEDDIKEIVRVVLEITDNELDIKDDYPLFEHIDKYYGVTLLESQMREIIDIVLEMHNEKPETCTSSIKKQYKEKGNQLDQVYGAIKEPSNNDEMETIAQKDFPFEVMDKESRLIYHETVNDFWSKSEYDLDGNKTYYANSNGYVEGWQYDSDGNVTYNWNNEGVIRDNRPAETIIINGIKYKRID